jgi:hypothetical protein
MELSNLSVKFLAALGTVTTVVGNLLGRRHSQQYFSNFFFNTITCPLHVSAPTGHLQEEYIY